MRNCKAALVAAVAALVAPGTCSPVIGSAISECNNGACDGLTHEPGHKLSSMRLPQAEALHKPSARNLFKPALLAPDPDEASISLPPGFRAVVFADNLAVDKKEGRSRGTLRFLAAASEVTHPEVAVVRAPGVTHRSDKNSL